MSELNTPIDYLKAIANHLDDFELEYNSIPSCKKDLDDIWIEEGLDEEVLKVMVLKPLLYKSLLVEASNADEDLISHSDIFVALWEADRLAIPFNDRYLLIDEEAITECSTDVGDSDLIIKLTILDKEFNAISTPTLLRYPIWNEDSWGEGYRLVNDDDALDYKVVTKESVTKTITVTEYHNV